MLRHVFAETFCVRRGSSEVCLKSLQHRSSVQARDGCSANLSSGRGDALGNARVWRIAFLLHQPQHEWAPGKAHPSFPSLSSTPSLFRAETIHQGPGTETPGGQWQWGLTSGGSRVNGTSAPCEMPLSPSPGLDRTQALAFDFFFVVVLLGQYHRLDHL